MAYIGQDGNKKFKILIFGLTVDKTEILAYDNNVP